jgi:hypothetical protein
MEARKPKVLDEYRPSTVEEAMNRLPVLDTPADFVDTVPYAAPAEVVRHVSNIMDLAKAHALPELGDNEAAVGAVAAHVGCIESFKEDGLTMQVVALAHTGELRKVRGLRYS